MSDFYATGVCPSLNQIEMAVRENGGIIKEIGCGYGIPQHTNQNVGGWQIRLVDTRRTNNRGSYIAVATNAETLSFQKSETLRILQDEVDNLQVRTYLADTEGLPANTEGQLSEAANAAEITARINFRTSGECGLRLIPLLFSTVEKRQIPIFADEKWAYYARHEDIGDGDDRHAISVIGRWPRR